MCSNMDSKFLFLSSFILCFYIAEPTKKKKQNLLREIKTSFYEDFPSVYLKFISLACRSLFASCNDKMYEL